MSIKTRLENLEKRVGVGVGSFYVVYREDDTYSLKKNGSDVLEDVEMKKDQFEKWQSSRLEKDVCFIVSRRDEN